MLSACTTRVTVTNRHLACLFGARKLTSHPLLYRFYKLALFLRITLFHSQLIG